MLSEMTTSGSSGRADKTVNNLFQQDGFVCPWHVMFLQHPEIVFHHPHDVVRRCFPFCIQKKPTY